MTQNSEYWQKRFLQLEEATHKNGLELVDTLEKQYYKAQQEIEAKLAVWYQRFADNNNISLADTRKLLNSEELKELKWNVKEYIKYGKENAISEVWMKQLENASTKYHITRLEALELQLQQEIEKLYGNQLDQIDKEMKEVYLSRYYHSIFEVQKGYGIAWDIASVNNSQLSKIITKPWAADSKNFSERIWGSKSKLLNELHTELTQGIMLGKTPDKIIRNISKRLSVSKNQAGRLVMTEQAYFSSVAQKDSFSELDVEKYEIVATLDSHTSNICRSLDGKVYDMKDYKAGSTAPPFHVWCRTTTVPYFEDNYGKRIAKRADGKNYYVDANMKYADWYNKYIKGNPDEELAEKKSKNLSADKKQFKKYKEELSEYAPKTFDEFQNIKYTDENEYGILKAQVKGMSYYNKAILNEPEITEKVKEIATSTNMKSLGLEYRIKTKDSYLEKIRKNYSPDGNEYEIKDIIRYTMGADTDTLADKTLQSIDKFNQEGYNTVRIKNTWDKYSSYNGINTFITAPNGQVCEMQYHTEESFNLKNGELHKLYEKQRKILDDESEEYLQIEDEMIELSSKLAFPKNIERVKNK